MFNPNPDLAAIEKTIKNIRDRAYKLDNEAAIVLSPEEIREISDIIYLHSEQRNLSNEQE